MRDSNKCLHKRERNVMNLHVCIVCHIRLFDVSQIVYMKHKPLQPHQFLSYRMWKKSIEMECNGMEFNLGVIFVWICIQTIGAQKKTDILFNEL